MVKGIETGHQVHYYIILLPRIQSRVQASAVIESSSRAFNLFEQPLPSFALDTSRACWHRIARTLSIDGGHHDDDGRSILPGSHRGCRHAGE